VRVHAAGDSARMGSRFTWLPLVGVIWTCAGTRDRQMLGCWAELLWTLADRQDRLSSADRRDTRRIPPGGTLEFSVHALRDGWRPTRNVSFTAAIETLANEDNRLHGSGLNEPRPQLRYHRRSAVLRAQTRIAKGNGVASKYLTIG
jgi:hypothetical protein